MKKKQVCVLVLVCLSIGMLMFVCVASSEPSLQKAVRLHHAEPPRALTALRYYERDGSPTAMLQQATILDHGVLQGPEPVLPNPPGAVGFYRQVVVLTHDPVDRALARERLLALGDRTFPPPPPPTVHLHRRRLEVVPRPTPGLEVEGAVAEGVVTGIAGRGPRSDSQNVHDSSVVKSVKASLERIGPSPLSTEMTLIEVRKAMASDPEALQGLDLVERNVAPLSALQMTEVDVLRRVWGRIQSETDAEQKQNMVGMLRSRLHECGKETSCASGRVARIVDSLSTFDKHVNLRPLWALRQEMLAKAAVLRNNQSPSATTSSLPQRLKDAFKREYVDTGLMPMDVMTAEVDSWGSDLD